MSDLPISRHQTVRFVPVAYGDAAREAAERAGSDLRPFETPRAYILAVPGLMERAAWRRDLNAAGARYYDDQALLRALQKQIAVALDEDDPERERLVGLIEDFIAAPAGTAPEEMRAEIDQVELVIRGASVEYASMLAARAHWLDVAPIMACRHFLRAQENPDKVFRRRHGLIDDAELVAIPEAEMLEVGFRIIGLMTPSKAQEKNSAPPSLSPAAPTTSPAENEPPTAAGGTSSATTTSETPASP